MDALNTILQGDALEKLKQLPSESVDCIITSPPYWALRDYGVEGQLGLEPTFEEYITKLCDIFEEAKRVLKKTGTCWINISDTYSGNKNGKTDKKVSADVKEAQNSLRKRAIIQEKSLCLIPFRFALEMVKRGWILRNTIIWHKPNCMPASIKDRFTVDFEYLFFFTKNKRYYFEPQKEPANYDGRKDLQMKGSPKYTVPAGWDKEKGSHNKLTGRYTKQNPQTLASAGHQRWIPDEQGNFMRNKRAVWTIPTQPFAEAHFATYPEKLCETPIKAGCPEFICKKCGKAREPIFKSDYTKKEVKWHNEKYGDKDESTKRLGRMQPTSQVYNTSKIVGLTDCKCNAGFDSGVVLDPFFGAGTTGLVALKNNRRFLGIEINLEYIKIAQERLKPFLEQKKIINYP